MKKEGTLASVPPVFVRTRRTQTPSWLAASAKRRCLPVKRKVATPSELTMASAKRDPGMKCALRLLDALR